MIYQKLESEKKNTRTVRKTQLQPMIRYQSLSMPIMVLSDSCDKESEKINIDGDDEVKPADDFNTNTVLDTLVSIPYVL
ncbi:hypothetical protein G9C98_003061 [Cotesia typhae]|uniref:Uncharacterized protein n=1 Tax=Cotesia typhae TaxID=2053667 RepID=A0A8J5QWL7_9HYME|nr:hypothetical protein G9C98_003061 [Cotesia typhae]